MHLLITLRLLPRPSGMVLAGVAPMPLGLYFGTQDPTAGPIVP